MSYEDVGFNEYFERKEEAVQKIAIEALPELSPADVSRIIEAIPPEIIQKKVLESENKRMSIDLDKGKILIGDGITNRIFLNGETGVFKISRENFNVENTEDKNLIFSSTFGNIIETHYTLSDRHRWTNSATFVYLGPNNPAINDNEPVAIDLNDNDFRDCNIYFEVVFTGDSPAKCETHLYNMSSATTVANSILLSGTSGHTEIKRTGKINLSSGKNRYAVRYRRAGGLSNDYPGILLARLVIAKTIT